jgi:hypothetical protein
MDTSDNGLSYTFLGLSEVANDLTDKKYALLNSLNFPLELNTLAQQPPSGPRPPQSRGF